MQKILNLKHAWEFILDRDVMASRSDYYMLSHIARLVNEGFFAEGGRIRGVHRSESYTMKLFHDELGITISHFVNRCKLEEAKSHLSHTEMTLSEISNYLCFSSQSYFQNLFKKKYSVTPNTYRKKFLHVLP